VQQELKIQLERRQNVTLTAKKNVAANMDGVEIHMHIVNVINVK
jgi:hypothetical protein